MVAGAACRAVGRVCCVANDARAAHASLDGKGLKVGELLDWDTAPLMFSFVDPDGNRFYVSEAG